MGFWYGDPGELDRIASLLNADAEHVHDLARDMAHRADTAHWVSISAQQYRDRVAADRRRADAIAIELAHAAQLLRAVARRVEGAA